MRTNPVVFRRTMAGLRDQGFVRSEKGHGGGWTLACDLSKVTMRDIYRALGKPALFAFGNRSDAPDCLVEKAVNANLNRAVLEAEQRLMTRFGEITLSKLSADLQSLAKQRRDALRRGENSRRLGMKPSAFDARAASSYAEGPPRQVPGYSSLHRMVSLLLAERTPPDGRVLVLGAGGGQELKALAEAHPGWSFEGVDPSADMLRLAEQVAGPHAARMRFHRGYIDGASDGPFDAATSILIFHFIPQDQRIETLKHVRRSVEGRCTLRLGPSQLPAD